MMSQGRFLADQYHQTFQTLLGDIQDNLSLKGVEVSSEFVVMMIKLVSMDPPNKFLIKQQMVPSELERMRKIVINRILGMSSLCRDIITMQLHYRMNYYNRDDSIEAHREDQEIKISSLLDEIKTGIPSHVRHYDFWYAKLMGAAIIEADMGPATEPSVVRETEDALMSVFPKEDINLLETMTVRDREVELYHLMHITIGIRLFEKNKSPDTYGPFIENLPKILPHKIQVGIQEMATMRVDNTLRLIKYTTLVQPYFLRHISIRMGRRAVSSEMVLVRQALVLVHQILIYLKDLTEDLNHEKDLCSQLNADYKELVKEVAGAVHKGKSVPRAVLHPKFVSLYESWRHLQDAEVFVDSIAQIVKVIKEFSEKNLKEVDILVDSFLKKQGTAVPSEKEFFNFPLIKLPEDKYSLAKRIDFRPDLNPLQMSYSGFCIHSLVKGVGLLVLSNPQFGIFNWKNHNCLLSNAKGAIEFRRDPDSFIRKSQAIARRWPELIFLLNIEKEAFDPATVSDADRSRKTTNILISSEIETQTEVHPVPSKIIEHYTWNEWELRRRGLLLSKIHKCKTHGTQTHWQALKQNAEMQTFSIKSSYAQTNRNASSEIPLSQFYIYGLRGLHCETPPHVVEITQENPTDLKCILSTKKETQVSLENAVPFNRPNLEFM